MFKEIIKTGRTIEIALEQACIELNKSKDEVQYEILEMPKKGFLGFGNVPAKVKVTFETDEAEIKEIKEILKPQENIAKTPAKAPKAPIKAEPKEEIIKESPKKEFDNAVTKEKATIAVNYLKVILDNMNILGYEITAEPNDDGINITLAGEHIGGVIGRRGETLDAIQYLVSLVANRLDNQYTRITIDSGNYREKREKTLENLARKIAANAVKTGRNTTLEPMNPYERRIIHATVSQVEGATSFSVGEEPNRKVVISSANAKKFNGNNKRRFNNNNSNYKGNKPYGDRRNGDRPNRNFSKPQTENTEEVKTVTSFTPTNTPKDVVEKPLYSKIEI